MQLHQPIARTLPGTSSNQWKDGKNPSAEPDQSSYNHFFKNHFDTQVGGISYENECGNTGASRLRAIPALFVRRIFPLSGTHQVKQLTVATYNTVTTESHVVVVRKVGCNFAAAN